MPTHLFYVLDVGLSCLVGKNIMNEVTIIVNTCDDYEDVWELFFCAFQEYWPGCKYQIVLNTESKNLCLDRIDLRTHNFDSIDGRDIWG